VAAFVTLSLVPTILLFIVAVAFIRNSVDHWFKAQVEQSLQGSLEVAQTYLSGFCEQHRLLAQQVSPPPVQQGIFRGDKRLSLEDALEGKRQEYI